MGSHFLIVENKRRKVVQIISENPVVHPPLWYGRFKNSFLRIIVLVKKQFFVNI
jgi:hypothetical protein